MKDIKEIRHWLWNSQDMSWVRTQFWFMVAVSLAFGFFGGMRYRDFPWIVPMMLGILVVPYLIFLAFRTYAIFEKPEGYFFSKAKLDAPFAGILRGSIGFHVTLTDDRGVKYRVDTRSIFHTRSVIGANMEDYVNRTVTVAHNPETGSVVVIG